MALKTATPQRTGHEPKDVDQCLFATTCFNSLGCIHVSTSIYMTKPQTLRTSFSKERVRWKCARNVRLNLARPCRGHFQQLDVCYIVIKVARGIDLCNSMQQNTHANTVNVCALLPCAKQWAHTCTPCRGKERGRDTAADHRDVAHCARRMY